MRRYAISALPWTGRNYTVTSFPRTVIPVSLHEIRKLIFRKIINIVATRCYIVKLKCTKIDFGCGCAPGPAAGSYSAPSWI